MSLRRKDTSLKTSRITGVNSNVPNSTAASNAGPGQVDPGVQPAQAAAVLVDYYFVVSMVFGGCCTYVFFVFDLVISPMISFNIRNVWAYEQLLKMNPRIGILSC